MTSREAAAFLRAYLEGEAVAESAVDAYAETMTPATLTAVLAVCQAAAFALGDEHKRHGIDRLSTLLMALAGRDAQDPGPGPAGE